MDSVLTYLRAHATSLSSYAVVVLTLASTLLASGVIGPDTTAYHVLGYVAAVLTALGFKAPCRPPLVAVDPADPWLVTGFVLGRGAEVPDPPVLRPTGRLADPSAPPAPSAQPAPSAPLARSADRELAVGPYWL